MKRNREDYIKLPESELAVMQVIWDMYGENTENSITAATIMERSPELSALKLTTVLTLITRLIGRGFVESEKIGRSNCYRPLVAESDYKSQAAADFLATVYRNDSKGLLTALWNVGTLSNKDIDELRSLIDQSADKK